MQRFSEKPFHFFAAEPDGDSEAPLFRLVPEPGDLDELEDSDPLTAPLAPLGADFPFEADLPFGADLVGGFFLTMSSDTATSRGLRLPCSFGLMRLSNSEISSLVKATGRVVTASMKL